ncbi:MAG: carbonic anhydrase [Desulfarculus sp.]|nr:MAG: carbonic anhydrase [Desulfarculus sp.]
MKTHPARKPPPSEFKPSAEQVLAALDQGNRRFREDRPRHPRTGPLRRRLAHYADQAEHALATVLACSDSRVPVERIFDAGIMDLFVVRQAGNVVSQDTAASLEYGVLHVHTPLVVVLGHTGCGAVTAAWQRQSQGAGGLGPNLDRLLAYIEPALARMPQPFPGAGQEEQIAAAVEENVWQALADLGRLSPEVRRAHQEGRVAVAGAVYQLADGGVRWLDRRRAQEALQGRP